MVVELAAVALEEEEMVVAAPEVAARVVEAKGPVAMETAVAVMEVRREAVEEQQACHRVAQARSSEAVGWGEVATAAVASEVEAPEVAEWAEVAMAVVDAAAVAWEEAATALVVLEGEGWAAVAEVEVEMEVAAAAAVARAVAASVVAAMEVAAWVVAAPEEVVTVRANAEAAERVMAEGWEGAVALVVHWMVAEVGCWEVVGTVAVAMARVAGVVAGWGGEGGVEGEMAEGGREEEEVAEAAMAREVMVKEVEVTVVASRVKEEAETA